MFQRWNALTVYRWCCVFQYCGTVSEQSNVKQCGAMWEAGWVSPHYVMSVAVSKSLCVQQSELFSQRHAAACASSDRDNGAVDRRRGLSVCLPKLLEASCWQLRFCWRRRPCFFYWPHRAHLRQGCADGNVGGERGVVGLASPNPISHCCPRGLGQCETAGWLMGMVGHIAISFSAVSPLPQPCFGS